MTEEIIRKYINQGEGLKVEFKEAKNEMPSDLFETICAFLNRNGGVIIPGVSDKGIVIGVNPLVSDKIVNDIVNTSNNPSKLNPPFILFPQKMQLQEGLIIYIQVPESSQVHKCNGEIYDRNSDGDFKLRNQQQIKELYLRKSTYYTEGKIYTKIKFSDFKTELFPKVRNLILSRSPSHPWLSLNNEEILKVSGLQRQDYITGEEGYTLAAALLFGKDEVIQNILPYYKIEVLVKIKDVDRYDDRLTITTNLIDAYDKIMDFLLKSVYLPDKFFIENGLRIDLREKIFREVVANLLVHREYTNAHIASIIIYSDRVELSNANKPYYYGKIDVKNFYPYPKNPLISKFFTQLGRVEEIGSGILNVTKYMKHYYPGAEAEFIDGDIFKAIIPIPFVEKELIKIEKFELGQLETIKDVMNLLKKYGTINVGINVPVSQVNVPVNQENVPLNQENVPVNYGVNEIYDTLTFFINEIVNKKIKKIVKKRLIEEIIFIIFYEKVKIKELCEKFSIQEKTAKRDMALLKKLGFVEFRGAPKTGHYVITDKIKQLKIRKKLK